MQTDGLTLWWYVLLQRLATGAGDLPGREAHVDPKQFSSARIDLRKLAQLFTGQQINPVKVICSECRYKTFWKFICYSKCGI